MGFLNCWRKGAGPEVVPQEDIGLTECPAGPVSEEQPSHPLHQTAVKALNRAWCRQKSY